MSETSYPKTVQLPDGDSVELRIMTRDDRDAALGFARALPEEDLQFLRVDLTEESVVDDDISTYHQQTIRWLSAQPGFGRYWSIWSATYPPRFRAFVQKNLEAAEASTV